VRRARTTPAVEFPENEDEQARSEQSERAAVRLALRFASDPNRAKYCHNGGMTFADWISARACSPRLSVPFPCHLRAGSL
jgi:hypothetical protein